MSQVNNDALRPYKIHPAASILPELSQDDYMELKEDIRARGLIEPILKKRIEIMDGRHRFRACRELRMEPRFTEYDGDDEVAEIISRNILRRHLTADQRVAVLAKLKGEILSREAKARMKAGRSAGGLNSAQGAGRAHQLLAKQAHVGDYTARSALSVAKYSPELLDEVIEGKRRLSDARRKVLCQQSATKHRPQKHLTLREVVQRKFQRFMDYWPVTQHREVKKYLRELL